MAISPNNRKILFHYPKLNVGGAEVSLCRMMRLLLDKGWEVELVLNEKGGGLENQVDPRARVTYLRSVVLNWMKPRIPARNLSSPPIRYVISILYRCEEFLKSIRFLRKQYQAAIVYLHGLSPRFCSTWVNANRRIHWIHTDLSKSDPSGMVHEHIKKFSHKLDHYICVSKTVEMELLKIHQELKGKTSLLYNFIDSGSMLRLAERTRNPFKNAGDNRYSIVTVCRINEKAKGILRMLNVHKRLCQDGFLIDWVVVGDGPDREAIENTVRDQGFEDSFIMVGNKDNPFPYYKYADVVAVLSYYEGLSGTVIEAKIMGKAVVATNFSGISEQLEDGIGGVIVDNDENSIYLGMKRILSDKTLLEQLSNDCLSKEIADDDLKYKKFCNLLGIS